MSFRKRIIAAMPMLTIFAYLLIGFQYKIWHPTWLIFLLIPLTPALIGTKRFRFSVSTFVTIIYLVIGLTWNLWHPWWLLFLLIPVFELFFIPGQRVIVIQKREPSKNNYDYTRYQDQRELILKDLEEGKISVDEAEERLNNLAQGNAS